MYTISRVGLVPFRFPPGTSAGPALHDPAGLWGMTRTFSKRAMHADVEQMREGASMRHADADWRTDVTNATRS